MKLISISDKAFDLFSKLIFNEIGITLNDHKKSLVEARFYQRIVHYEVRTFEEYYTICLENIKERTEMLNLITTNETYFFREPEHFNFLKEYLLTYKSDTKLRVWSAAASVGAEAYSIAMLCDTYLAFNMWEVLGSDINEHVIKKARMGLYPITWSDKISPDYKHKYCLKGKGKYEGKFLIDRQLAKNVRFLPNNLLAPDHAFGNFDIVFLRNVLIYFNTQTRQHVIENILKHMRSGSYLIISQTENLNGLDFTELEQIQTSIFRVK